MYASEAKEKKGGICPFFLFPIVYYVSSLIKSTIVFSQKKKIIIITYHLEFVIKSYENIVDISFLF